MQKVYKTIKLLLSAFKDLLVLHGLWYPKKQADFAFLVHPRDIDDIVNKYHFLKYVKKDLILLLMVKFWPVRIAPIEGLVSKNGTIMKGVIIACPHTAAQLMNDRELARIEIKKAAQLANKYGAQVLGLGALTASLSRGGLDIKESLPNMVITTGRFYTVLNIGMLVQNALNALEINSEQAQVAVVGAAGSIGAGVAQLLAYRGILDITLIDLSNKADDVDKVIKYIKELNPKTSVRMISELSKPLDVDVVITATNRPDALLEKEHLIPGTIIVDDAQPSDVSEDLFKDPRFLVLEGGVVNASNIHIPFNMGLQNKNDIFSCLGEVLLIMEGTVPIKSPLGRELKLDIDLINSLQTQANILKYTPGAFQNYKKLYTMEDVACVKTHHTERL